MIVTVRLADDVYSKYVEMDRQAPAKAIERQLERFQDIPPSARALTLSVKERQALEKMLGTTILNGEELVKRVERMVSIEVGGKPVELSEGQRKRLSDEAKHWLKDPSSHTSERVTRLLFESLGA